MPRTHFEIATGKQEEHEHRDRIEVNLTAAPQCLDQACCVNGRDGEGNRDVHPELAESERAHGAGEEWLRRIEDDGCRYQEAHPAKQFSSRRVE